MRSVCPHCGSAKWRRRGGVFRSLRVCLDCQRRYTPPASVVERLLFAAVFLVPALVFGILAVTVFAFTLDGKNRNPRSVASGMSCGFFLGVFAVILLVQAIRELAGRARHDSEEKEGDSQEAVLEYGKLLESPPMIAKEQAEELVRSIAEQHRAKGVLRKLGHFPEEHLANAAKRFAQEMREDETPLVLADTSLMRNGKAGLLLTNRALYSSWRREPIRLADIHEVAYATPGFTDFLAVYLLGGLLYILLFGRKSLQNRLLVNDKIVCAGANLRSAFWIELLTELAEEARAADRSPSPAAASPEFVVLEVPLFPRSGQPPEIRRIRAPVWQQIEQSIRDLDQENYPSLRLWAGEPEEGRALEILGGNGIYALRELGEGWVFYDSSQDEEEIEVCTGGPGYRCPAFYVCRDLRRVLAIAHHYFVTGTPE